MLWEDGLFVTEEISMKKLAKAVVAISAMAMPVSGSTMMFGPEGINHTLSGGDITLVPAEGITTLQVAADQSSYGGKVTVSELVNKVVFIGNGAASMHLELLNPGVTLEFPEAPDGVEYNHIMRLDREHGCYLIQGPRNVLKYLTDV
jgi:hypothetical protein